MNHATAKIIASSTAADTVVASAARISTTQGTALEIYGKSCEKENNGSLIEKVVASGHTSTLEHQLFTVAFDNVSVCTEEFVIEFRLGSYTVKSRRYVDFTSAGFYIPPMPEQLVPEYQTHMQSLFDAYAKLLELEIPKEDARYLLPYCFRSNFYCTMNARELLYMVTVMCCGRGSYYPELKTLGESLKEQLRAYFPNLPEQFAARYHADADDSFARYAPPQTTVEKHAPETAAAVTELRSAPPQDADEILMNAQIYNGMFSADPEGRYDAAELITAERPRELELLHAQFVIRNLSLAAITHLVRHRIQTVLVPHVTQAVYRQHYVLPESIRANADALAIYQRAFTENAAAFDRMCKAGLPAEAAQYFALAGNQLDVLCDMNGRELLHFMKLRTCNRAQWEIRACAIDLLRQLRLACPAVFRHFGPSCYVTGKCPEGRLTCGKLKEMQAFFSSGMEPDTDAQPQMKMKISFFENQLAEAIGAGVYQISVRKDQKQAVLYIGESCYMLKRCAEHLYALRTNPEYFGFTADTINTPGLTLIFEIAEAEQEQRLRKKKQYDRIKNMNPLPLSQSGKSDDQKEIPDKIAAMNQFLES